jgi:hypothetical protein
MQLPAPCSSHPGVPPLQAGVQGGAFALHSGASHVLEASTVSGNAAGTSGGGAWLGGPFASLSIVESAFTSNHAGSQVGAPCSTPRWFQLTCLLGFLARLPVWVRGWLTV